MSEIGGREGRELISAQRRFLVKALRGLLPRELSELHDHGSSMLVALDARAAQALAARHRDRSGGVRRVAPRWLPGAKHQQHRRRADALLPWPERSDAAANATLGRRLVASDLSPEFSRRLAFHNWVEHGGADRAGLARYLRAARRRRLPAARDGAARAAPASQRRGARARRDGGFLFDAAFAAQAHHLSWRCAGAAAATSSPRALRAGPPHYLFGGCGALGLGQHVARHFHRRYYCIESDEFPLRGGRVRGARRRAHLQAAALHASENVDVARPLAAPVPAERAADDFDLPPRRRPTPAVDAAVTSIVRYLRLGRPPYRRDRARPPSRRRVRLRELNDEGSPDAAAAARGVPVLDDLSFRVLYVARITHYAPHDLRMHASQVRRAQAVSAGRDARVGGGRVDAHHRLYRSTVCTTVVCDRDGNGCWRSSATGWRSFATGWIRPDSQSALRHKAQIGGGTSATAASANIAGHTIRKSVNRANHSCVAATVAPGTRGRRR